MSIITFSREEFIALESEAKHDYYYWETVNKTRKEKQCFNSIRSCRVGVFCEYAIQKHLLNTYDKILELKAFGREEKKKRKHFRSKPDIYMRYLHKLEDNKESKRDLPTEFSSVERELKIEIKGISEGQPKGQILTTHGQKYYKNKFTHVAFCELYFDEQSKTASVEIYLIDKIKSIIKYPIAKNKFGKECYTNPNYLYMVKAHK